MVNGEFRYSPFAIELFTITTPQYLHSKALVQLR